MANPYNGGLQRGTKQFPNGTNVLKTGPNNNRGPAGGLKNNRPAKQSTSSAVSSQTYQPWATKNVAGTTGVMSASAADPDFSSLKSPIRKSLAKRKAQGPTKMLGNQAGSIKLSGGQ